MKFSVSWVVLYFVGRIESCIAVRMVAASDGVFLSLEKGHTTSRYFQKIIRFCNLDVARKHRSRLDIPLDLEIDKKLPQHPL